MDTSALNRLLDDDASDAIITALLAIGTFRTTAYNVVEVVKEPDPERRRALLRLIRRLSDGKRPLDRPNTLIRAAARGFADRFGVSRGSVGANSDPNLDSLFDLVNEPERADDDACAEATAWAKAWEDEYDAIVSGVRVHFQQFFRRRRKHAPITTAATFRSHLRNVEQYFKLFVAPIYERETGKALSRAEFDDLIIEPMWALYLGGYTYATHQRSVRRNGFARKHHAGGIDLGQAVYLRLCDRFLTSDGPQYRALRFLNRFNDVERPEVIRYETFRGYLVLPSFASG
jgi:hypothetical protein